MQTLNVYQDCQVRIGFDFTKTRRYNTKLHDTNKKKTEFTCFEWRWLSNGMKVPWFSVFSFLFFCLKPTVRKITWMRTAYVTVMVFFSKAPFWKLLDHSSFTCSKFFLSKYEVHWQRHLKETLQLKILQA